MSRFKDALGDNYWQPKEHGSARANDPSTSKVAAVKLDASTLLGRVYRVLKLSPIPLTQWEVTWELKESKQSISPRFRRLEAKGLIERVGKRLAKNDKGGMTEQEVWQVKAGREVVWKAKTK